MQVKIADFLSRVTLKFDGWPWKTIGQLFYAKLSLVHYFKAIGVFKHKLVRKRSIQVKIGNFWFHATFKFDIWPWKTKGHLFHVASSFMHHIIAISEFQLELQFGNAQFGSKSMIFLSCVTLKFDRRTWQSIEHLF